MLFRGVGTIKVRHISNIGKLKLFATPELSYENALQIAAEGTLVLISDEVDELSGKKKTLYGEKIFRTLLKKRGIRLESYTANPSVSHFKSDSRDLATAVRRLYDLLHENVRVNVFDVEDFTVVEENVNQTRPVINLNSKEFSSLLHILAVDRPGALKLKIARVVLLIGGGKFNQALKILIDLLEKLD